MGSSNSKEFQPLPLFNDIVDFTVALKCVAANIVSKVIDVSAIPLDSKDREEFNALELRKLEILREIRKFVIFINLQVKAIKLRIEKQDLTGDRVAFLNMTYGPDETPVAHVLNNNAKACFELAEKYREFGLRLEKSHFVDKVTKKVVGGILIAAGVIGAAALIFFSAGTAAPAVIGAVAGAAVVALGTVVVGAIMVSPSEVERATTYLKKVGIDLANIGLGLDEIIPYYEPANHMPMMENLDYVMDLTNNVSESIKKAIEARFKR